MKYYRLLWLLPAPFLLYILWVVIAFVFGVGTVSGDMVDRALAALVASYFLSIPAWVVEISHD